MEVQEKFLRQELGKLERLGTEFLFLTEDKKDDAFWRKVLTECRFSKSFKVSSKPPSKYNNPTGGKSNLEEYHKFCKKYKGRNCKLKLCLDSDYDFLIDRQDFNVQIHILQTYVYSFENYKCWADSLNGLYLKAIQLQTTKFDFAEFLSDFSTIIFDLFLVSVLSEKHNPTHQFYNRVADFCETDLKNIFNVNTISLTNLFEDCLQNLNNELKKIYQTLSTKFNIKDITELKQLLNKKGVNEQNCYLFIQGHFLFDEIVLKVLKKCLEIESKNHIDEIESENDKIEYRQLLNKNKLKLLLLNNFNFYTCQFFQKIEDDVEFLNS